MGMREDIGSFDLGRLTLLGWLVLLVSFAAGIGAAIAVGSFWDSMFGAPPPDKPRRIGPAGIAGVAGALAFFFGTKVLLSLAGVRIVRPKAEKPPSPDEGRKD
jgi:hypothetical protein